jgi:hypothetical protein
VRATTTTARASARDRRCEEEERRVRHIATFCGSCNCGCPELYVDEAAAPDKRIVITDDFGQRVQMSVDQFSDLVASARNGVLDELVGSATG